MSHRVGATIVALTAAIYIFFRYQMQYPWQLALLSAVAIGALVYSAKRTFETLRLLISAEYEPPAHDS